MKSMIADQDKETSDEQTLSEEKDRFDDEKGKKKAWVLAFNHTPQSTELLEHLKNPIIQQNSYSHDKLRN
jgi:hypothetical protein